MRKIATKRDVELYSTTQAIYQRLSDRSTLWHQSLVVYYQPHTLRHPSLTVAGRQPIVFDL